mgnify:FL=1
MLYTKILNNIKRSIQDPLYFFQSLTAFLRGFIYIFYYRLFTRNIRIGFPFRAHAPVRIIGPGAVSIGRNCAVYKNVFKGLTIVTYSKKSTVSIGNRCLLGGLTIRCKERVVIGERTMTAISLIQDSFFMNLAKDSYLSVNGSIPVPKPIFIGNNVWLGADSIVLGGSIVGDDCVVGAGSLCFNAEYKEYSLISGNPAKKTLPIDKLLRLTGAA